MAARGESKRHRIRAVGELSAVPANIAAHIAVLGGANAPLHDYQMMKKGVRHRPLTLADMLERDRKGLERAGEQAQSQSQQQQQLQQLEHEFNFGSARASQQQRSERFDVQLGAAVSQGHAGATVKLGSAATLDEHAPAERSHNRHLLSTPLKAPVLVRCAAIDAPLALNLLLCRLELMVG